MHTGDSNTVEVSATEWISGSDSPDAIQYSVTQHENTIEVDVQKTSPFSTGNLSVDLDIALPTQNSIQATLGAGNVTIDGISGLVNVQTSDVDFTNGTVQKSTSFQTNAGSIAFVGKLAPNGTYEFSGDAGSIDITLPADSAFVLDASTNAGSVSNAFHSTSVGQNPTSQLHVHIDVGNIRIHQG